MDEHLSDDRGDRTGAGRRHFGHSVTASGTTFRLWAPEAKHPSLVIDGQKPIRMTAAGDGFFEVTAKAPVGTRYQFRVGDLQFPDLASRQQEKDADGWSLVTAPLPPGSSTPIRSWQEAVICEVHVGTASPEGTFLGLIPYLEHFRDAGFTALEIMPVNEFPGRRGWGYDGTLIFAPEASYGTPADLRALVDAAHALGLMMILDVVYNHFGTVENHVEAYARDWFSRDIETPWGAAIDFSKPVVRKFYSENAAMWLAEYDFDGLRFDAVHEIKGDGAEDLFREVAEAARAVKPRAHLIIEDESNSTRWLHRDDSGEPLTYTAEWNDDLHHALVFLATKEARKMGYDDPSADPIADLEKALAHGFVHDPGEGEESDGRTRGGPASRLPPEAFVSFVENHDQIGNRSDAGRLSARISPEQMDFLNLIKFVTPQIPLCFMGDEANIDSPFPYFVDLPPDIGDDIDRGRYRQMDEQFGESVGEGALPHPNAVETFEMARFPWAQLEEEGHQSALRRFRELAAWRQANVVPLLSSGFHQARSARQGDALIVNWAFEAGTVSVALNPGDQPLQLNCDILGAPVSSGWYDRVDGVLRLGPWSAVAWSVRHE